MPATTGVYVRPPFAGTMRTNLTREECSLLTFLETCMVDNWGQVRTVHMNEADFAIAKRWTAEQFVKFSRMKVAEIEGQSKSFSEAPFTHRVQFSPEAFETAAFLRRARAERHSKTLDAASAIDVADSSYT